MKKGYVAMSVIDSEVKRRETMLSEKYNWYLNNSRKLIMTLASAGLLGRENESFKLIFKNCPMMKKIVKSKKHQCAHFEGHLMTISDFFKNLEDEGKREPFPRKSGKGIINYNISISKSDLLLQEASI